jgi:gluconolactonase
MKTFLFALLMIAGYTAIAQAPVEKYVVDSASVVHAGVPKGEILKFTFANSKIYPGTVRDYWIYVPAQYDGSKPACVYVNQDFIQYKAPTVFDNLIHAREMPATIGVFISPGVVPATGPNALARYNRSFEYDALGRDYVNFLLTELLPDVETKKTSDGRAIRLSKSGNDRAIGGSSSGAIASFNAAWERPDAFTRVFSTIGTFVSLRGGDRFPGLIRKYEPKPIRIFLHDGSGDLNSQGGDWWMANQTMERAFKFAGYEVAHVWGEGGHNWNHSTAIFPDVMRFLWKDYPAPVKAGNTSNTLLKELIIPNENWELVGDGYAFTEGPVADKKGDVYFQDLRNFKTYKVSNGGKPVLLPLDSKRASGTAIDANGNRYTTSTRGTDQVLRYDAAGKVKVLADSINGNDLVVAKNGNVYVTAPNGVDKPGIIYLITPDGKKRVVDEGLRMPNGVTLTPDQSQLYVAETGSHFIWLFQIAADGSLINKQRYAWIQTPGDGDYAWPDGLKCDSKGRLYVATNLGIQVVDQLGKVNAIIPIPFVTQPSNLCFGGPDFNVMYVTCGDKVYRRKFNVRGVNTFEDPIKPEKPNP